MSITQPFAVFDIDGTVIRWQLYHAMSDVAAKKGIIDNEEFENVRMARMGWKRRSGEESYHDYEQVLVKLFEGSLKGLRVKDLEAVAQEVFEEYKDQVYTYTRDLLHTLKAKNYKLFAISGSPNFIIEKLVKYYDFDDYAASSYESKDGIYTGDVQLTIGKKAELLRSLMKKHKLTSVGSIGVGDSEGDIPMLEITDTPIAFNPTHKLAEHAKTNHWPIIVERKNVIYSSSYHNGTYELTF